MSNLLQQQLIDGDKASRWYNSLSEVEKGYLKTLGFNINNSENYFDSEDEVNTLNEWKDTLEFWETRLVETRERLAGSDFIEYSPDVRRIKANIEFVKLKIKEFG